MALRLIDGFDHIGTNAPNTVGKWATGAGAEAGSTASARTGTHGLRISSAVGSLISKALPASGGAVIGVAFRTGGFASAQDIIQIREGVTVHVAVEATTGGVLAVKRGATTLATGSSVLAINTWYYLELKVVIDDTTGSYTLRIDGVVELTASGVDTKNGGTTGQWDRLRLGGVSGSTDYDDLYVCDTSGSTRNDFLGICKVETLLPQTDAVAAGTHADLTPSTGTDHGALVDEASPNTTDYNSSATVGHKDTYQFPSLSLTGAILGVQTNLYVAKSDAAAREVCPVLRVGGTDYDGASVSPSTTFGYDSQPWAVHPGSSADFVSGDIDGLQAGMKVTA